MIVNGKIPDGQRVVNAYFDDVNSYWAEIYERAGDMHGVVYKERLRILLQLARGLALPEQARVLEVGCGAGHATVEFARFGCRVESIDSVPKMVERTRERATAAGVGSNVTVSVGDVNALAFPDESFSLVVAMGVLPWLPSMEGPMDEIYRVLVSNGKLILGFENRWGMRQLIDPLVNPLLHPAREWARRHLRQSANRMPKALWRPTSLGECDALLDAHGFEKMRGITFGFGPITLFGREVLPHSAGLKLHEQLQNLAYRGMPVFRSAGALYTVMGRKRDRSNTHAG